MTSKEAKQANMNLFDNDDDNEDHFDVDQEGEEFDLNIEEKLNRSERKTNKLIELQSKFAYDSRFKIDDRFLDEDEDEQEPKTEIEEEKSKNLAILEQVLGKKFRNSKPVDPVIEFRKSQHQLNKRHSGQNYTTTATVLTPRFDPTKVESKIYEIPDDSESVLFNKRKVNIDFDELDRKEERERKKKAKNDQSEVADSPDKKTNLTENYYEVSTNLKESLAGANEFSIGSLFGFSSVSEEASKAVIEANENATFEPIKDADKKKMKMMRNPFKYDSSDEEDETIGRAKWGEQDAEEEISEEVDGQMEDDEEDEVKIKISPPPPPPKFPSTFLGFFFKANDPRLSEDPFYSAELVEKARANGKERSLSMMRALSLRKRAALKNVKGDKKFAEKLRLKKKLGKGKRSNFRRFNYNKNNTRTKSNFKSTNENKV